jgi:hypothetical protein
MDGILQNTELFDIDINHGGGTAKNRMNQS